MLRFTEDQQAFIRANRSGFNARQSELASTSAMVGNVRLGNAETLPRDVWQEWDAQAVTIQREELVVFNDLANTLSRPIPIGKIISNFAKISDSGSVNVSLDGRSKARPDRPTVEYDGVPVPIIDSTFSFGWRMVEAARSEGGMGQLDDAARANANRRVTERAESHALDGNDSIVVAGKQAYGLRTHPNRATRATGVVLNGATGAEWVAEIKAVMQMLHARNFRTPPTVYVNWDDWFYATSTDFSAAYPNKTIAQRVQEMGLASVVPVPGLAANEIIAIIKDRRVITVLNAMPLTTRAQFRANPEDEYNFVTMMAAAIQIRGDVEGNYGIAHSSS